MDDLQRQPDEPDRETLRLRVEQAHSWGRIGAADRDIRLANVRNAQSMAELDLIRRELDQLGIEDPPVPVGTPAGAPYATFEPRTRSTGKVLALLASLAAVVVVLLLIGAAVALLDSSEGSDAGPRGRNGTDPVAEPSTSAEPAPPSRTPTTAKPAQQATYSLTEAGIRTFLTTYRARFGTTQVVDLVLYGDYAIVNVPVPGKARQSGWLHRQGRWTEFGGVRAVFPGATVVDTNRLDARALMRNVRTARRTLDVEEPTTTYAIVRHIRTSGDEPQVSIHVANEFRESAHLLTRLDGTVVRAYPYRAG